MKLRHVRGEYDGDETFTSIFCFQRNVHVESVQDDCGLPHNVLNSCDCHGRRREHYTERRWVVASRSLARRVSLFIRTGSDDVWARHQLEIRTNYWISLRRRCAR